MSKLHNIFKGFIHDDNDSNCIPLYEVGERTIWVLHPLCNEYDVQDELEEIEWFLDVGGYEGEYRVEMNVLIGDKTYTEHRVYDMYLIKIPHSSSLTGYEAKQR
jgi:hypothetical protein